MIELNNVPEIPGGEAVQKAINDFNKKAAGALWGKFKRIMATASEPFFRRDLGERYFTAEVAFGATLIWLTATILSCKTGPLLVPFFEGMHFNGLAGIFDHQIFPAVGGTIFIIAYLRGCIQNFNRIGQFRNEGKLYHTMSRGQSRWEGDRYFLLIAVLIALFIFVPVLCIMVIISHSISAKLAAEQQAAIYSSYLDALDKKIEEEFMEDALLGECAPEITYLSKELPRDLNPELRNNIAAAAVGKPVSIVAQGPRKRKNTTGGQPNQTQAETSAAEARETPVATSSKAAFEGQGEIITNYVFSLLKSKRFWLVVLAVLIVVTINSWGIPFYRSLRSQRNQQALSPVARPKPALPLKVIAAPATAASDSAIQNAPQPAAPVVTTAPKLEAVSVQVDSAAQMQAALELQKRQQKEKIIQQITSTLANQTKILNTFKSDCESRLGTNTTKLASVTSSHRRPLLKENDRYREALRTLVDSQDNLLIRNLDSLQSLSTDPQSDPQKLSDQLQTSVMQMEQERQQIAAALNNLDSDIASAPKRSGFLIFK